MPAGLLLTVDTKAARRVTNSPRAAAVNSGEAREWARMGAAIGHMVELA